MPRNSSGTYSLPSGNPVVTQSIISSSWANTTMDDLATAITDSLSRSGDGGMLAALELDSGTIGAPGLTWGAETTSGLYRAGAGDFRWAIAGTDVWSVTASLFQIEQTLQLDDTTLSLEVNGPARFESVGTSANPTVQLSSTRPVFALFETDATANNGLWVNDLNSEQFRMMVSNDAGSSSTTWLSVDRTLNVVDSIALASTALTWNGSAMVNVASSPTWTGNHVFTGVVTVESNTPDTYMRESDGVADGKLWRLVVTGGSLLWATRTDANGTGSTFFSVTRSGTTVDTIALSANTVSWNGSPMVNLTSSPTWTNQHSFNSRATFAQAGDATTVSVNIASSQPWLRLSESDAASDNRSWDFYVAGEALHFSVSNSAGTVTTDWIIVQRTGTTIDSVEISTSTIKASTPTLEIENTSPRLLIDQTGAGAHERLWRLAATGGTLVLGTRSDVDGPGQEAFTIDRSGTSITTFNFNNGTLQYGGLEVGFRGLTPRSFSTTGNSAATDDGKALLFTGAAGQTLTLTGTSSDDAVITIVNDGTGTLTISGGTTLEWFNGSGATSTGNRSLAIGGVATAWHSGSGNWRIWGTGLS